MSFFVNRINVNVSKFRFYAGYMGIKVIWC